MKKSILTLLISMLPLSSTLAGGQIDYLNIDNNTVHFSTNGGKSESSPACVNDETSDNWTISLASTSGSAMYSLLITATAGQLPIDVVSGNDCADSDGTERAASVAISSITYEDTRVQQKPLNLYKGDGETLLGRIVDTLSAIKYLYLSPLDNNILYSYTVTPAITFFTEENCTGTPMFNTGYKGDVIFNPLVNDGKYVQVSTETTELTRTSTANTYGVCTNYANPSESNYAPIGSTIATDETCGTTPCIIKEE